ncbi:O-antigen ligase family protein [Streptomyces prasinus]|uniref:O-antigen ligase domain-containing protein n=1 Tax=Streptomyces prasinus TaxID=67345 RepID=A0ABX6AUN4_9ACTN|nr:O-antigen ligase family protein [Streptomyces prasinus]QEV06457.1 O-antigen ligase domain-containing protein [Streptomyces prasinus]
MSLAPAPLPSPLARRAARLVPVLPLVALPTLLALPVTHGGAGPADVVSGLVVVYCVIRLLRERRRPLSPAAAVVLGLPVVGLALAAMGASSPEAGLTGLGRYLQVFVLVPAAVLILVRDRTDFRVLAWSFVGLALWQGAVGVHQYATGTGASYQGEDVRAVGTFGAHDVMGMATAVSLGLVCAAGIALGRAAVWQRVTATGCAVVLLLPLALSFSRGAWIATALTCAVQLVLTGPRRTLKVALAAAAAGVVLTGGFGIGTAQLQERVDSIARVGDAPDQSVVDRYALWASAGGMWREQPLTGVGLKGFPEYRDGHAALALSSGSDIEGAGTEYRKQALLSPHNMYLLVLSEQGLIGLLSLAGCWLALLVGGGRRLLRARGRVPGRGHGPGDGPEPGREPVLDCGLVACGLLLWLLTDFVYGDIGGPSTLLVALGLGLAAWWALAGGEYRDAVARSTVPERVEEAAAR